MKPPIENICCPYCAVIIPSNSTLCVNCGKEFHSDLYLIVPDGSEFGIAFEGEIKVHGLTLEGAKRILSILNRYLHNQPEDVGE